MGVLKQSFEGSYDFKLDAKYRVSVPSEWRPQRGEGMQLRLLEWETEGVPVLKVLTDEGFEGMIRSIDESEGLTPGEKGLRKGMLHTMNTAVMMNSQGKMLIPKKLADERGLEAGGAAHLFGRGTNFDIVSPGDHAAMIDAHEKLKKALYGSVDFS